MQNKDGSTNVVTSTLSEYGEPIGSGDGKFSAMERLVGKCTVFDVMTELTKFQVFLLVLVSRNHFIGLTGSSNGRGCISSNTSSSDRLECRLDS